MTHKIRHAPADLTFDPVNHVYRHRGQLVRGTTSVLQSLHSFAGIRRDVLEAAQERGTAVHAACEYWDQGDLDENSITEIVSDRLGAWKRFTRDMRPNWIGIEARVFHPTHRFAGTCDRFGLIGSDPWTIDIKTAAQSHPVWGLQTAAYSEAGAFPGRRGTVRLLSDGTYRLDEWKDPTDFPAFISALTLLNWQQKNGLKNDH